MKRQKDEVVEEGESESEISPKERKKRDHQAGVEKRRKARNRDKVARWGGLILLGLMMFVGFLLWVGSEIRGEDAQLSRPASVR